MLRSPPTPRALLALALLGGLVAFEPSRLAASPAAPSDPLPGVTLPWAANAAIGTLVDAPVVSVVGSAIRLDGQPVGDAAHILSTRRMMRVDGQFQALNARREAWKAAHAGGAPFSGEIVLAIGDDTPAVLVKSVFQTAAFAGYPNVSFLVRAYPQGALGRLRVDAQVPGPPTGDGHGGLSEGQIRAVVKSHEGALRACYESEARNDPSLRGGVTTSWDIDVHGAVANAKIIAETLNSPRVEGCIVRQIASWSFPASDTPTNIGSFPFRFGVGN